MPPKKSTTTNDDLVEALLDACVIEALGKALENKISKIVKARLESKLSKIFDSINVLKAANVSAEKTILNLKSENNVLRNLFEELDANSKSDNLIFKRLASLVIFRCCIRFSRKIVGG